MAAGSHGERQMPTTLYHITDERRNGQTTMDADRAERLSRAGLTVTAEVVNL